MNILYKVTNVSYKIGDRMKQTKYLEDYLY